MTANRQPDGKNRVLLVEDNPGDVRLLQESLRETGEPFEVFVAPTLAQAAEQLAACAIDATLLDLSLPDSHGADTVARLRKASHYTAIVVMTGNIDERVSIQAAESGAEGYLIKGETDPALLLRTLRIAVQRRRELLELETVRANTEHRAVHDPLTGLPNRLLFRDRLAQALLTAARTGRAVALLFIDLDHFKTINDTLGHAAGDRLLCESARRMQESLRASDTVARLGGDEFAVLLTNLAQRGDAERLAAQLHRRLREPVEVFGRAVEPGLSIGIAVTSGRCADPEELLAAADAAMYRAKRGGRNRLELAEEVGSGREPEVARVQGADELELRYAPRVCARSGRWRGLDVELTDAAALAAQRAPEAAERLLERLCERLPRELCGLPPPAQSEPLGLLWRGPLTCVQPLLPLAAALGERGLRLELCLADARFFRGDASTRALCEQLERAGIALALQCGEPLEQLARVLRETRLRSLRLHAPALGTPQHSPVDAALLWGLAQALERLGIEWLVSDVESVAQAEQLASLGCPLLQGPLFGVRLPLAALAAGLATSQSAPAVR